MTLSVRKATWLASLGAGLEYYDFVVYGMMVGTLNSLFFASGEAWVDLIKGFAVFAVGYLMRPIGGLLFGAIGDVFGRKKTFVTIMLLMALATFAIGLLPTYAQIGGTASFLLIILRLVQGVSFGAELPGAITVVAEYAHRQKSSTYSGFVLSSTSFGSILASALLFLLSTCFTKAEIAAWAWRIPFLLGGSLAVANYFIRKYLQETPEFAQLQQSRRQPASLKEPIQTLFRSHLSRVLSGMGMTLIVSGMVIFGLYQPTYLSTYFGYGLSDIYLSMSLGLVWSSCSLPVCGYLADRFGRVKTFFSATLAFTLLAIPLFSLLPLGSLKTLILFQVLLQTFISFLMASYFALLAASFPTSARYTGIALCYNTAFAAMGFSPLAMTWLIKKTSMPFAPVGFLIGAALISLASLWPLYRRQSEL